MKPERSEPSVSGRGTFTTLVCDLIHPSHGPTPVAATRTSPSPGPGVGRGTSSMTITLGGPNSCIRAAFISGTLRLILTYVSAAVPLLDSYDVLLQSASHLLCLVSDSEHSDEYLSFGFLLAIPVYCD